MPSRAQACAWFAGCCLVVPSLAFGQDRTEREIVELILRDGPRARAIRAEAEARRREQLARLAYPNPVFSYSREGAGFAEFFQLEQVVPVSGARAAVARAGTAAADVAAGDRDARLWVLRTEAAGAVAALAAAQARLEAAEAHTREGERLVEILRTREREGEGSRFDRLRAEQELADIRLLATTAAIGLASARATVAAMLPAGMPVGVVKSTVATQAAPAPIDVLISRAMAARADLRALRRGAEWAGLEAVAARRARLPAPAVFGGVKRGDEDSRRTRGGVFGIGMSLPLFDAGGREAARWTAERGRSEAQRESLEQQIRVEVARSVETLDHRSAALRLDPEGAGDELAQIAEVAYREGEMGILELLDAIRTASRARLRTIELRLDARLAQIAVESATGDVLWP